MKICNVLITSAMAAGLTFSQTTPTRPEFEVVSIKPAEGLIAGKPAAGGMRVDGAQVHFANTQLRGFITTAYKRRIYQVIGPDWLANAHFDVDAKLPAGATRAQIPEMLKSMLEDRFQIKVREDSKDFSVYGLVLSRGAPKLKDMTDPGEMSDLNAASEVKGYGGPGGMGADYGHGSSYDLRDGKFEAKKFSMSRLASLLTSWVDRPVIDMTGLVGAYDIAFAVPDDELRALVSRSFLSGGGVLPPENVRKLDEIGNDSLLAGLRAAGLKLEARKAPVSVLVIESILKSPTNN